MASAGACRRSLNSGHGIMPAGKPGISGGVGWSIPLSHAVNIRSLRLQAKWTPSPAPLTKLELRAHRDLLRKLASKYRIACGTPQPTATDRRKILRKIKTSATRFNDTGKRQWAYKLLNYLGAADLNTRALLSRELVSQGHRRTALSAMKRELGNLFSVSIYPGEPQPTRHAPSQASLDRCKAFLTGGLPIVRVLAKIDANALVPANARWPDPPLAELVTGLEPVWRRVTGRTAGLISVDAENRKQVCRFAEWLGDVLQGVGLPRPSAGRVLGIVQDKKRKIRLTSKR